MKGKVPLFDPATKHFEDVFCSILDAICEAVTGFDRLETQLYIDWFGPQALLKVSSNLFNLPYKQIYLFPMVFVSATSFNGNSREIQKGNRPHNQ